MQSVVGAMENAEGAGLHCRMVNEAEARQQQRCADEKRERRTVATERQRRDERNGENKPPQPYGAKVRIG